MADKKVSIRLAVEADNVDQVKAKLEALGLTIKGVGNDTSTDRLRRQFEALERSMDPAAAAAQRLAKQKETLRKAVDELGVSEQRAAQLQRQAEAQHDRVTAAATRAAGGTKLAAHEVTNLTYQIQDAAVQLAGGQNPFLILMQQGPQATGAVGGVGRALSLLATPAAAALGATAALAGGFALVIGRAVTLQAEFRQFSALIRATGNDARVTAQQLQDMVAAMTKAGASRADAVTVAQNAAMSRALPASALPDVGALAVDMGQVFGGTAEAGKKLTDWLSTGVKGLRDLTAETGALSVAQYEAARAALEHGNKQQALSIVIGALHARFDGLQRDALSPAQKALKDFHTALDDLIDTAANKPVTIRIVMAGGEWIQGLANFLKNPSLETASLWNNPIAAGVGSFGLFQKSVVTGTLPGKPAPAPAPGGALAATPAAPGLAAYPAAPPGTPIPRSKPTEVDGLTPDQLVQVSDAAHANERLAEAMRLVGVQRQIFAAGQQAFDAALDSTGNKTYANEMRTKAEEKARIELSGAIAEQTAEMDSQTKAAQLNAAAAGQGEAAMRRASIEAAVYAARLNGTADAVRAAREAQEAFTVQQIRGDADKGLQDQIRLQTALAAAYAQGPSAVQQVQLAEQARALALREATKDTDAYNAAYAHYLKLLQDGADAERGARIGALGRQNADAIQLAQTELGLVGQSAEVRAQILGHVKAELDLRRQFPGISDDELRGLVAQSDQLLVINQRVARQQAAWDELGNSLGRAFDRLGDSLSQVFTEGNAKAVNWGNVTKAIISSLVTDLLKMAAINPLRNALFGGSAPSLWDLGGSALGAASQTGGGSASGLQGATGNLASLGSSAYQAYTGGGIMASAGNWIATSQLGQALGWGTTPVAAASTVGAATGGANTAGVMILPSTSGVTVGASGGVGATTSTTTAAGSSAMGAAGGALGAAGAGFAAGSLVGGFIGTKANSYGAGVASGAASGAAAGAAMGSVVPVIGTAIGAVIGAIAGAIGGRLGTQKIKTPYGGAWVETDSTGAVFARDQGAENGVNASDLQKQVDAINGAVSGVAQLGGFAYDKINIATEYSSGPKGKGPLTHIGGWDGEVVSKSDSPAKVALDILTYLRNSAKLTGVDGTLSGRVLDSALATSDGSNIEEVMKAIGLAKSVTDGTTALKELDKSLHAVQVSAFNATAQSLQPMVEELDLATKYGFGDEYKGLVSGQLANLLDDVANPKQWTQAQTAIASVQGQLTALRQAAERVNPDLAKTADRIEKLATERIYKGVRDGFAANLNEATGKGFLNQLAAVRQGWDAGAVDALTAGVKPDEYVKLYDAQARAILNGLDDSGLDAVAAYFKDLDPVMAGLARSLKGTTQATKDAAAAQQTMATSLRGYLDSLGLSDLSSLSPTAKMQEAQRQFGDALASSRRSGDVAAATKAADALLSASSSVLIRGTAEYAQQEQWVRSTLTSLGHELGLPGFKTGGSFEVGGWGGVDSTLVRFKATPGERVTVTRPDQRAERPAAAQDNSDVVRALSQVVTVLSAKLDEVTAELARLTGEQTKETNRKLVAGR